MAATFLQRSRHKSVYYFRRKVPVDLRRAFGVSVVYKTLTTAIRREAVVLARALAVKTDELFSKVRAMSNEKENGFRVDYGLSIDLDELTGKKRVSVHDIKPGEEETARQELLKVHDEVLSGRQAVPPVPATPSINECLDLYFAEDTNTKPRTKHRYAQMLGQLVAHFGPDTPLGAVDQAEFNKYADRIKATDRNWNTQKNYIGTAARFLVWSSQRGRTPHAISAATLKPQNRTRQAFSKLQMCTHFKYDASKSFVLL